MRGEVPDLLGRSAALPSGSPGQLLARFCRPYGAWMVMLRSFPGLTGL